MNQASTLYVLPTVPTVPTVPTLPTYLFTSPEVIYSI